jgi:elongation factor Tu
LTGFPQAERGVITKNQEVEIVGMGAKNLKTTVTGIGASSLLHHLSRSNAFLLEMFHKELDRGEAGDDMGTLLRGIKREQVRRGMVIAAAGSMKSHTKFIAQIYVSVPPLDSVRTVPNCYRP